MKIKALVMIVALFTSVYVNAASGSQGPNISTAKGLLDACETTSSSPDTYPSFGEFMADLESVHACHYYIAGFLDAHTVSTSLNETNTVLYCLPKQGITPPMVSAALGGYLREHPEHSNESARLGLALALRYFFVCNTQE